MTSGHFIHAHELQGKILERATQLRRLAEAMLREAEQLQQMVIVDDDASDGEALASATPVQPQDIYCISPKSAAFECQVSVDTIERLHRTMGMGKKMGGLLFFTRREIDSYKARED